MEIKRVTLDEWGQLLPASGFEVFHTPEALSVLDAHTSGDLQLLGGFKGKSPVALLPAFVRELSVGRAVFSPPPGMGVPRLGPIVMPNSPKRSKQESVTRAFVEGVIEELDANDPLSLLRMQCSPSFTDPRPFNWEGFNVEPAFTYLVDVDKPDIETVLEPFSRSRRREFRRATETELSVTREGMAAAERIVNHVGDRYDERDDIGRVPWPYVRDLLEALPDRSRVYVARDPTGEYLSGIITLISDEMVYFWQGGVSESYEATDDGDGGTVSVNSLVHRTIIEDALTDPEFSDVGYYDLVGANTRRLCAYKSKFGGQLSPYYVVESSGMSTTLAKAGYRFLTRHR
ncbi:GNAT family N-acetyltransferase [Halapricum desulfuricans]|uniref:Peptidoglycan interpeptide bridge formation enzyme, contains acetyltransferase domain of GNAT superfamily n=1 Tax=Halapricum desulfuricans TaxID=2841257 RepID=A0A897MZJ3_9EURY|nr:GNAT family N-acetyltransferase [Halapricum desulfuricans]QSG05418.1 Peptidoglycan interpeptide bridge formation enzyme, contains acetyltransferase domain of GNAT superfamily [Halapricum desulfuricans]